MRKGGYTDQQIIEAVQASFSIRQVLRLLGLHPTGANYKGIETHFLRLGLDTSHFTGQGHLRGKTHSWTPERPLEEILVENSTYRTNQHLKRRLFRAGLLVNRCYICGQEPVWRGEPLRMVLDHKNGNPSDNRIENLWLLSVVPQLQQSATHLRRQE